MRVIKKISLRRGLERIVQPNPSFPKITRHSYYLSAPYKLTPGQQLHKYGVKPVYFQYKWVLALLIGSLGAIFWKTYLEQMYYNQLDTIYRYRYHQQEYGMVKLKLRLYLMKTVLFIEENYSISALFKRKNMGQTQLQEFTEGVIRYRQYEHYVKNKDKKFEFLDIGVLQKYPYPKKVPQMQ